MPSFSRRVLDLLRRVPAGHVTTYRALGEALSTRGYRAIGQVLKHNPFSFDACSDPALQIPCHRVVAADGTIGGFMGSTTGAHIKRKITLLRAEGVRVDKRAIVGFHDILVTFTKYTS